MPDADLIVYVRQSPSGHNTYEEESKSPHVPGFEPQYLYPQPQYENLKSTPVLTCLLCGSGTRRADQRCLLECLWAPSNVPCLIYLRLAVNKLSTSINTHLYRWGAFRSSTQLVATPNLIVIRVRFLLLYYLTGNLRVQSHNSVYILITQGAQTSKIKIKKTCVLTKCVHLWKVNSASLSVRRLDLRKYSIFYLNVFTLHISETYIVFAPRLDNVTPFKFSPACMVSSPGPPKFGFLFHVKIQAFKIIVLLHFHVVRKIVSRRGLNHRTQKKLQLVFFIIIICCIKIHSSFAPEFQKVLVY